MPLVLATCLAPPPLPQRLSNVPGGILEEDSIVPLFGQFPPWDSGRHSTTTGTDYLETELQVRDSRRRLDAPPMAGPGLWAAQAAGRGRNLVANLPPRSHHVLNWPDDCPRCHQNSQAHYFHATNSILSIIPQVDKKPATYIPTYGTMNQLWWTVPSHNVRVTPVRPKVDLDLASDQPVAPRVVKLFPSSFASDCI